MLHQRTPAETKLQQAAECLHKRLGLPAHYCQQPVHESLAIHRHRDEVHVAIDFPYRMGALWMLPCLEALKRARVIQSFRFAHHSELRFAVHISIGGDQ